MANKPKHAGGRPTVMTSETIAKLENAFALGCCDEDACKVAGIGTTALYDYCKLNPKFAERKEELKFNPVLEALNTRALLVKAKDWNATKDVLDRNFGKAKEHINIGGDKNNPLAIAITVSSDKDKEALEGI